ncbi:SPFH domain-containing protein [Streptomyces avicenniae]|uniref:SPFH domain-containing protein n=1 Tax=Streptomyces avicenniae TaxID=500153 RepID=UPI00069C2A3C|nr:SPFH domain-containing protein [Streptomyces avicenniae]
MTDTTPPRHTTSGGRGPRAADVPAMPEPGVREFPAHSVPGGLALLLTFVGVLAGLGGAAVGVSLIDDGSGPAGAALLAAGLVATVVSIVLMTGLNMVAPGEARVVQFFGRYTGTIRKDGLRWVNPLTTRGKISTRVRNHETAVLKVNDAYGNPIELAAVVVWQVEDTAQASFEVDDFIEFVSVQTESAVRHIALDYPYDAHGEDELSLRGNAEEITDKLAVELTARVAAAGVRIIESRFTHLAYAPEIASAMLQRQQAGAVVAARKTIVEGACGMVEDAVSRISEMDDISLDDERRAAMVSNLLVVLCGDRSPQPVLNTGTLYQ